MTPGRAGPLFGLFFPPVGRVIADAIACLVLLLFNMKISQLRVGLCLSLVAVSLGGTTGCSKVKGLFSKKSEGPPSHTETSTGAQSPPPNGTGEPVNPAASPVASAAPKLPPAPTVNKSAGVMVLCYHRLEEKPRPNDPLAMTPGEFEKEMQQIKDAGFSVIPMQDFLAWRRGDKDIPAKSCVVTIDDGYVSGYDTAWPILKKFGYPFTMFVYINYIGSGGKSISWDQLAEMRDAGVDIQSHTFYHSNLRVPGTGVDKPTHDKVQADIKALGMDGYLRKEIADSKQTLEKQLGIKVNCIAYPYGVYSQKVRDLVKEAGYEAGFTVYGQRISYSTPAFDIIGRYAVEQSNPKIFQESLTMTGGGTGGAPASGPSTAQLAATSMVTVPAQGETIANSKPLIKANLSTMGEVDPKTVEMRVSGLGKVTPQYDEKTKTLSYQVTQPLRDKNYTVILSAEVGGKRAETRWDFNFDPTGAKPQPPVAFPVR